MATGRAAGPVGAQDLAVPTMNAACATSRIKRALAVLAMASTAAAVAQPLAAAPAEATYGPYAVGVATGFAVDNMAPFDAWNSVYGNADYRALLRRIDASGQRRTVVFQLWYPALPSANAQAHPALRQPLAASSGRPANYWDFFFQAGELAPQLGAAAQVVLPQFVHLRDSGTLASATGEAQRRAYETIGGRILDYPQGAWQDATPADGKFPVILLAHGLAGSHAMWRSFAEFLASRGYVVAAPTFVSDGGLPLVFHDQNSPFARQAPTEAVADAYQHILGNVKVVPYFYRLLFGQAGAGFAPPPNFDPTRAKVLPGGVDRATAMMRNLFRQRVADVTLVLRTVRHLGDDAPICRASLAAMGAVSAADPLSNHYLCELLNGRIDKDRVGIAGHSLGSMTAQLAANHLPDVRAALGLNNAPPLTWTPEEMLGGETAQGVPASTRKPLLLMIGDEDDFVQNVFVNLFTTAVRLAGGDPEQAFPLAAERAAPDRLDNPQPVALSAWQRALAARLFVIVRDTDHFTLVEDFARSFPWPAFQRGTLPFAQTPHRNRKPTGEATFAPSPPASESYTQLGWTQLDDGSDVYLPHIVRDWYAAAWFDWHLKDDASARERLAGDDPFGTITHVRKVLP